MPPAVLDEMCCASLHFTPTQCATLAFRALRSVGERYALRDRFASCNADATLSDLICAAKPPNEQQTTKKQRKVNHAAIKDTIIINYRSDSGVKEVSTGRRKGVRTSSRMHSIV